MCLKKLTSLLKTEQGINENSSKNNRIKPKENQKQERQPKSKRTKTKYTQMPDDCEVKLERMFKTECCDCGLVHLWELKMRKKVPIFRIKRDNRATAQRRRKIAKRIKRWTKIVCAGVSE